MRAVKNNFLCLIFLGGSPFSLGAAPLDPQAKEPSSDIAFYANYMDVFNPAYPTGEGQIPGLDNFPLLRGEKDSDQTRKEEAEQAQAYGFDGFELWPSFSAAEKWIDALDRIHFNPQFKIFPQMAFALKIYPTYDDLLLATRHYLKDYGNNARIARLNGKPLISSWGYGPMQVEIPRLRADLAKEGLEFVWVPTINRMFPPKLAYDAYDGINDWDTHRYSEGIAADQRNAAKLGRPFYVFGSVRPGYDNGNRIFTQDINPFNGVKSLLGSFEAGLKARVHQLIFVTWNDGHETASFPSWFSPYGYEEITRSYRSLYANEPPTNLSTQVVVAYDSELLLGDQLEVQFVLLPGRDPAQTAWSGKLAVENERGEILLTRPIRIEPRSDRHPALVSVLAAPPLADNPPAALSLVVTGPDGVARRLAPVNVRAGRPRTSRPFVVALDRVADVETKITAQPEPLPGVTISPLRVNYHVKAGSPVSQLQIMDGLVALSDIESAVPETSSHLFLALDSWGLKNPVELKLDGSAAWRWKYAGHAPAVKNMAPGTAVMEMSVDADKTEGVRHDTPVAVAGFATDKIDGTKVEIASDEFKVASPVILPLAQLFQSDVTIEGRTPDTSLRVRLMEDGHVLNRAPHFNVATIDGSALLPAVQTNEPYRVLSLSGQLENGKVFFSPPLVWVRVPAEDQNRTAKIQVVDSGKSPGGFVTEKIVIEKSEQGYDIPKVSRTRSPEESFAAHQVTTVSLPRWRLMGVNLPMDEGRGWLVGSSDSYLSPGWAWRSGIMDRPAKKWVGPGPEDAQWVWDADLKRPVLEFYSTSRLSIRSRSGLSGSFTLSFDLKLDAIGTDQKLFSDADQPGKDLEALAVSVQANGCLEVTRNVSKERLSKVDSKVPLTPKTWHKIVVLYDLTHLHIVQDGKVVGSGVVPPELVRSASVPFIGANSAQAADGFAGRMADFSWRAGADTPPPLP